jgi:hypothetical protein
MEAIELPYGNITVIVGHIPAIYHIDSNTSHTLADLPQGGNDQSDDLAGCHSAPEPVASGFVRSRSLPNVKVNSDLFF